jgi:ATP-dependent DNA helicase PIF1
MSYLSVISRSLKGLIAPSKTVLTSAVLSDCSVAAVQMDSSVNVIEAIRNKRPVILIHGRAGTGKTTLIRKLIKETKLNHVVVAPTGVAALNAGGQTIHSFFRIPPRMINLDEIVPNNRLKTILRRLDFIVIDEISMVRADLLDAIDRTLRVNRASDKPFGGVPMVMVGDFLQLPPIVEKEDSEILKHSGYESHFAFGAKCMQMLEPTS